VTSTCSTSGTGFTEVARKLTDAFGDAVHAVDVRLAQLAAVGVDRQPATDLDRTVGDEVFRLTLVAEPQLLQLHQRARSEVVIQDRGLNIGRLQEPSATVAAWSRPTKIFAGRCGQIH
jgi:hypothetical protein